MENDGITENNEKKAKIHDSCQELAKIRKCMNARSGFSVKSSSSMMNWVSSCTFIDATYENRRFYAKEALEAKNGNSPKNNEIIAGKYGGVDAFCLHATGIRMEPLPKK